MDCFCSILCCSRWKRCRRKSRIQTTVDIEHQVLSDSQDDLGDDPCSPTGNGPLRELQKRLDIQLKLRQGAENLVQAYSKDPYADQDILGACHTMLQNINSKIDTLNVSIHQEIRPAHEGIEFQEAAMVHCNVVSTEDLQNHDLPPNTGNSPTGAAGGAESEEHLVLAEASACFNPSETNTPEEPAQGCAPDAQVPKETDNHVTEMDNNVLQEAKDECSPQRNSISLQDFHYHSVLGRGGYGKVMLAEFKNTKKMFAIKTIKMAALIEKDCVRNLINEKKIFQTISSARHPFLVNLFASFHTNDRAFFVMEYAGGGDLITNLKFTGIFPEAWTQFYSACIILGLEFLHEQKIIHRDLKLSNVVLDSEGFAKITDFGISKKGIGFGDRTGSVCGTLPYMAPEMMTQQPYTKDVDWWALGVMIYMMQFKKSPFSGKSEKERRDSIVNDKVEFPPSLSIKAASIIKCLLHKDPALRLGSLRDAEDVKEHPFLEEINWSQLMAKQMRPPYSPSLSGPDDVRNFKCQYTSQSPVLTPPKDQSFLENPQEVFTDFNWVAEWSV